MAWNDPIGRPNCTRCFGVGHRQVEAALGAAHLLRGEPDGGAVEGALERGPGAALFAEERRRRRAHLAQLEGGEAPGAVEGREGAALEPGACAGSANRLTPASPALPGARAATTRRSAECPSSTWGRGPASRKSLPGPAARRATSSTPSAPGRPLGPVQPSVAIVCPPAMPGRCSARCASLPASRRAPAPRHTVAKNGAQSSASPIGSRSADSSTAPRPSPP